MTLCPWRLLAIPTYDEILCLLWNELDVTLRHCSSAVQLIRPLNKTATLTMNIIIIIIIIIIVIVYYATKAANIYTHYAYKNTIQKNKNKIKFKKNIKIY